MSSDDTRTSGPAVASWSLFGVAMPSDTLSATLARNWWAVGLRGLAGIAFGLIALILPDLTLASLVLLFAAYMVVDGIFAVIAAVRAARSGERWGLLVLAGIADFVAGAIAFFWPLITVLAFVYLLGSWAIVSGVLMWSAAFRLNLMHGRWLMALGGAVSVCWGVLLLTLPFAGAIVLTWWIGAYALVFGAALLALAHRLRRLRHEVPSSGPLTSGV
jgi:uncharacterized membrane protein HdeD (DUF308 family)